jgi:acetyl esterase/lipase
MNNPLAKTLLIHNNKTMEKLIKSIHLFSLLLFTSLLTSCVSSGLKVINSLAKSKEFESYLNVPYADKKNNDLNLYVPKNLEVKATVVFFYGGCWGHCSQLNKDDYLFVVDTLIQQGYAVVVPDYRKFPKVGFTEIIQDAKLATLWTLQHLKDYGVDNKNIFLMGHSAGAHMAAMLVDDEKFLGEDLNKINGFIGLAGPYDFYPFTAQYMYELFSPENNYFNALPINFINGNEPPHLLLQGKTDKSVFVHNSVNLGEKLSQYSSDHKVILYEKMSHSKIILGLSRPLRNRLTVLNDINDFIENHSQN